MSMTVYAYFNIDQLAMVMDAVAAITNSQSYLGLLKLVIMIGFIVFIAGMAIGKGKDPLEFFRWFLVIVVIHSILLVPKVDVIIEDRTSMNPPTVRSNIPIGLAFFASATSHIGDYLTRTFETVFALPDNMQFQKTGLMFGNTVVTKTLQAKPTTPAFESDLVNFINNCTYYDIISKRISEDALVTSQNAWSVMANTSNALMTPSSTDPDGVKVCSDAYDDLTNRWGPEITKTMQSQGRALNPGITNVAAAGAQLESEISDSYQTLLSISRTATETMQQNMVINSMRTSVFVSAQNLDSATNAMISRMQTEVETSTNLQGMNMARIAEKAGPAIRNAIEIICYAVFPIIILLLLIAGEAAGTILKGYVMTLLWIQLIPPLYAVLNFVMTKISKNQLTALSDSNGVPLVTVNTLSSITSGGISDLAIAGFLTLSIPAIAWALVKSGEVGGAALFGAVMNPASSSAAGSANEMAKGNISQGNVTADTHNLNNTNANKYDTAPTTTSGFTKVTDAQGTTTRGSDGTFRFQANQSSLGYSASMGNKIANALSTEAASRKETSIRESEAATEQKTAALVGRMSTVEAWASTHGTTNQDEAMHGSHSGKALSTMNQIAENINRRLGLAADSNVGKQVVGEASLGASIGPSTNGKNPISKLLSASFEAALGEKAVTTGGNSKTLESALGYAKDQLKLNNITADKALSDDFKQSEAYQWGTQNRNESTLSSDASLSKANIHTKNAEAASLDSFTLSSQARSVKENWTSASMDYQTYLANEMDKNQELGAYNQLLQSDPDKAAQMAARHLGKLGFDLPPTVKPTQYISQIQSQSPELKDKEFDKENQKNFSKITDNTASADQANKHKIKFRKVNPKNTVSDQVSNHHNTIATELDTKEKDITSQNEEATKYAKRNLSRNMQITGMKGGEKPKNGSAPAQHDQVHRDLFDKK